VSGAVVSGWSLASSSSARPIASFGACGFSDWLCAHARQETVIKNTASIILYMLIPLLCLEQERDVLLPRLQENARVLESFCFSDRLFVAVSMTISLTGCHEQKETPAFIPGIKKLMRWAPQAATRTRAIGRVLRSNGWQANGWQALKLGTDPLWSGRPSCRDHEVRLTVEARPVRFNVAGRDAEAAAQLRLMAPNTPRFWFEMRTTRRFCASCPATTWRRGGRP
jgi:hypothetical protein